MSDIEVSASRRPRRRLAALLATACLAGTVTVSGGATAAGGTTAGGYRATIVRTAYGVPHITAGDFGSLGYGFGYAFASDDVCTMADDYVTVEGERSRYFGPDGTYDQVGSEIRNLDSDLFWRSVIDSGTVPRLLAVTAGPSAVRPEVRRLMTGYTAGYDAYLASVGGSAGVTDPTCRGKPWVRPITEQEAYLRLYQLGEIEGRGADPASFTEAAPPAAGATSAALPTAAQLRTLATRLTASSSALGSNAVAVGSAGTRGDGAGILLGNPHFPWNGPERFYEAQLTIPGTLNVEGATLFGTPIVLIGFNSSVAWSHTVTPSLPLTLYQLTLVPGHPTEYVYGGRAEAMTSRTVTVLERTPHGLVPVTRTLWSTRWGPVIDRFQSLSLPWSGTSAFVLADANAGNFRFLNDFFATDEATSTNAILAGQKEYEGMPWVDTVAADSAGHALYSDIGSFPDVTDAEAARCDTPLGAALFAEAGLPVLDASRPSCA